MKKRNSQLFSFCVRPGDWSGTIPHFKGWQGSGNRAASRVGAGKLWENGNLRTSLTLSWASEPHWVIQAGSKAERSSHPWGMGDEIPVPWGSGKPLRLFPALIIPLKEAGSALPAAGMRPFVLCVNLITPSECFLHSPCSWLIYLPSVSPKFSIFCQVSLNPGVTCHSSPSLLLCFSHRNNQRDFWELWGAPFKLIEFPKAAHPHPDIQAGDSFTCHGWLSHPSAAGTWSLLWNIIYIY